MVQTRLCGVGGRIQPTQYLAVFSRHVGSKHNHDGYGQRENGGSYKHWGVGRAWPLMTGERGHYETLALNTLHRIKPLLAKQYVTAEQVDDARTKAQVAEHNYQEAAAALCQALAQEGQTRPMQREAQVGIAASQAKLQQSINSIDRLGSLIAQRPSKAAKWEGPLLLGSRYS